MRPALVVLDWGLPDLDSAVVARLLRADRNADVPILLVTADGQAQHKARQVNAFAYLHKPFEVEDLTRLVRSKLGPIGE